MGCNNARQVASRNTRQLQDAVKPPAGRLNCATVMHPCRSSRKPDRGAAPVSTCCCCMRRPAGDGGIRGLHAAGAGDRQGAAGQPVGPPVIAVVSSFLLSTSCCLPPPPARRNVVSVRCDRLANSAPALPRLCICSRAAACNACWMHAAAVEHCYCWCLTGLSPTAAAPTTSPTTSAPASCRPAWMFRCVAKAEPLNFGHTTSHTITAYFAAALAYLSSHHSLSEPFNTLLSTERIASRC